MVKLAETGKSEMRSGDAQTIITVDHQDKQLLFITRKRSGYQGQLSKTYD